MTRPPARVRQLRVEGWRLPPGARSVARGSRFGNPYRLGTRDGLCREPAADLVTPWEYEGRISAAGMQHAMHWPNGDVTQHTIRHMTRDEVVATHRRALIAPTRGLSLTRRFRGNVYQITVDVVRAELAGRDLACFCHLDQPCHADTLLWAANAPLDEIKQAAEAEYAILRAAATRVAALHPDPERAR